MQTRRRFVQIAPVACAALFAGRPALAQPKVAPTDPQAVALGYVNDATQVDRKKYGNYKPGQTCGTCSLYQGKPSDEWAGCPLFAGKVVNVKGWCTAFAAKA